LSERAKRAVKKVKVTPNQFGNTIEVEMHDKLSALRLLAKHRGLLEPNSDNMRPSMIGINITGPKTSIVDVEGEDG
jgi:phospholipase C